jgi:hypothetical protein
MEFRFCKFCQCEHPLTDEWWYFGKRNKTCKKQKQNYDTDYRSKNRYKKQFKSKEYYRSNKDQILQYREINQENIKKLRKDYYTQNKQKEHNASKKYQSERYASDPTFKLRVLLRSRITKMIKRNQKSGSAVSDLGCKIPELMG